MDKYRILCFDGGGIKGALTVRVLHRLCAEVSGLLDNVTLIAGTSTGGLITLGLGAGKSPEDLLELYKQKGSMIFKPYMSKTANEAVPVMAVPQELRSEVDAETLGFSWWDLLYPKYNNVDYKTLVTDLFSKTPTLDTLKYKVLITAFQLNNPQGWCPVILTNFKSADNIHMKDLCADVALRTSAAPTYFPLYQGYTDGGVFANNPSMLALAAALDSQKGGARMENIRLLSLGTGATVTYAKVIKESAPWGIIDWLNPGSTSGNAPNSPLISILMDGVNSAADYTCSQLLSHDQYCRFNVPLDSPIPMDDYTKVDELIAAADNFIQKNPTIWNQFVNWVKVNFM